MAAGTGGTGCGEEDESCVRSPRERCALFRASFLTFKEEVANKKVPWRSKGCANCDENNTHALHSALLHIGDESLPNWTRAMLRTGSLDEHMSCTDLALVALGRSLCGRRRLEAAQQALERTVDDSERAKRARVEEEREFFRPLLHVIQCDCEGEHILRLSNWLLRAKLLWALPPDAGWADRPDWTQAAQWAKRCGVAEELRNAIKWGDRLSEVLLRRSLLREDHFSVGTVDVTDVDKDLLQRCEDAYEAGWCRVCAESLEQDARNHRPRTKGALGQSICYGRLRKNSGGTHA